MILKDNNIPALNGLVLAGGKSVRMGQDKSIMQWHGKEQRYYLADMLQNFCSDVYISCREDQLKEIDTCYKPLADTVTGVGPSGAILTAFGKYPDRAWLIIACDLPLLDTSTLQYLIEQRDAAKAATTFESPYDGLPEPLITIWEPKSFKLLQEHISDGFTCPRKALTRNIDKVKIIKALNPDTLINTNTPEDVEKVKTVLNNTSHVA